ncbi:MAG: sensor histidine kinase [Treponema sp.]|nr:sensor histidine kinase [Treponema sp.]
MVADITQNACESGAQVVELEVRESALQGSKKEFRFLVKDNGKGMTKEELGRAIDPFVTDGVKHPQRKIGLGLPFLIQTAEQSGGGWDVQSEKGKGTTATAWFDTGNVDTPPTGDLPVMFRTILMFDGPDEVVIRRRRDSEMPLDYEARKSELVEALGGLEDAESLALLGKYLRSQEENEE